MKVTINFHLLSRHLYKMSKKAKFTLEKLVTMILWHCGNYYHTFFAIFGKNFVKATNLPNKSRHCTKKNWFDGKKLVRVNSAVQCSKMKNLLLQKNFSCMLVEPLMFWLPSFFVYFSMTIIKWRIFSWRKVPKCK